ncbi:hypothetical protein HDK77DRAFT_247477 [Phyllosticta capitalensis]
MRLAIAPSPPKLFFLAAALWLSLFSTTVLSEDSSSSSNSTRNCYYPDGIQSKGLPCFPDQAVSPCCGRGFICLSNGLCEPGSELRRTYQYKIYRSACTDASWNSSSCPSVCIGSSDNLDSGQGLAACGTNGSYCCGRGYDCCANASNIFNYGVASAVTTLPYSTATSTSSSSSSTSASSSSSSSSSSSNRAIAIGVGVGVGVGVGGAILVTALIGLLLYRKKRKTKAKESPLPPPTTSSAPPHPPPPDASVPPSTGLPQTPHSPTSPTELHPQSTSELPDTNAKERPQELHGQEGLRSELPGSTKDPAGPPPEYYPLLERGHEVRPEGKVAPATRHELEG